MGAAIHRYATSKPRRIIAGYSKDSDMVVLYSDGEIKIFCCSNFANITLAKAYLDVATSSMIFRSTAAPAR